MNRVCLIPWQGISPIVVGVLLLLTGLSGCMSSQLEAQQRRQAEAEMVNTRNAEIRQQLDDIDQRASAGTLTKWERIAERAPLLAEQRNVSISVGYEIQALARLLDEKVKSNQLTDAEANYELQKRAGELYREHQAMQQQEFASRHAAVMQVAPYFLFPHAPR
jgi:hypothetical protein